MSPFEESVVIAAIRERLPKTSEKAIGDIVSRIRASISLANACSVCGRQYLADLSNNHDMQKHAEWNAKEKAREGRRP